MAKRKPTLDRLRELLDYDLDTGIFRWRLRRGPATAGAVAGALMRRPSGAAHRVIRIDGRLYYAHRLAWMHTYGVWPTEDIDHINSDGTDNRLGNLRLASRSENSTNKGVQRNNRSGRKGVSWHARAGRWQACIGVNGRTICLGLFNSVEEAHAAYMRAATEHFGEFARGQ